MNRACNTGRRNIHVDIHVCTCDMYVQCVWAGGDRDQQLYAYTCRDYKVWSIANIECTRTETHLRDARQVTLHVNIKLHVVIHVHIYRHGVHVYDSQCTVYCELEQNTVYTGSTTSVWGTSVWGTSVCGTSVCGTGVWGTSVCGT